MRAVFGFALGVGSLAVLAWIAGVAVAESVDGWGHSNPDARFGLTGRRVVAAVFGFGMAGLSAAYAGWPMPVARKYPTLRHTVSPTRHCVACG